MQNSKVGRVLKMDLPKHQSAFLWGPRKTGKSTFLKMQYPDSLWYDFLQTDVFLDFSARPSLLREQLEMQGDVVLSKPIILDEVQKVPQILDEVHWLIENRGFQFVLCGSSARKLKRGKANLLGGRAWRFEMFPFVFPELSAPDLLTILNRGLLPNHYLSEHYGRSIKAYVQDYLKEEVFEEGLARDIPAFSRFFEAMAYSHGEMINFSNIARDAGVKSKVVKEYFQILEDTLLGRFIAPYFKKQRRNIITKAPKFYLFDVGVAGYLSRRTISEERGELFGRAFEHYILMELIAYNSYREIDVNINYWRTKTGLEVDFIMGDAQVAIEVKGSRNVKISDLRGIKAFVEEHHPAKAIVVCNEQVPRLVHGVELLPWRNFLEQLWAGEIIR